ncbi:MAG: hypothetical protein HY272_03930 [Gammaproteobacteria bacterium]|nr:hypothetical protein [Gammaproteobacteria bacterium]
MYKHWLLGGALVLSCLPVLAEEALEQPVRWTLDTSPRAEWLQLASADEANEDEATEHAGVNTAVTKPKFKEHLVTASKIHKYLGIGSLGLAGLTLLAPKEEDGAHEYLAKGAAALGVGAVITGLVFHWDDIELNQGFDNPDNLHALLTTLGTLGFLGAVSEAPASGHAGLGAGGAISMAIGIKMTW